MPAPADISSRLCISMHILGVDELWQQIENSQDSLSANVQFDLLHILMRWCAAQADGFCAIGVKTCTATELFRA